VSPRGAALPPFERVLDEHGPAVLRFCVARAGAHAGEDVFQETMIAALRAYPELRDPGAVRGWLFSIAHRKTIDAARSGQRTPRPAGAAEEVEVRVSEAPAEPGDDAVWGHVRALPSKQRSAVTLRYLADLTYDEIGTVMDTSPEAARRSVFEGLRRLRAAVEPPGDDPF
jgi:RNA polymerase sigma factor (sigma-70 family)